MAIRITNAIADSWPYISIQDEAIDTERDDFDAVWEKYIDGMGEPPVRPGSNPATFTLRHLSHEAVSALAPAMEHCRKRRQLADELGDEAEKSASNAEWQAVCVWAAKMSLEKVAGVYGPDGQELALSHAEADGVRVLTQRSAQLLPRSLLVELGSQAIRRSQPSPK